MEGGPSPDPGSVETKAQLARALKALFEATGSSYEAIARSATLSTATVHGMCSGKSLPRRRSLELFVQACGGDPEVWAAALRRVRDTRGSADEQADKGSGHQPGADVSVYLRPWVTFYGRSPYAEALLRGIPVPKSPEGGRAVGDLAEFPAGIDRLTRLVTVQVVTCHRGFAVPVHSPERFWALVAADLILQQHFEGSRKWLVKQTERIIGDNDGKHLRQLRLVWRALFELLLRADTLEHCAWPPRQVIKDVDKAAGSKTARVGRIMSWLLQIFPADHIVGSGLHRAWKQRLATAFPDLSGAASRSFDPSVVRIDLLPASLRGEGRGYAFDAMRYPLTVGDMAVLWPDKVAVGDDRGLPYVLGRHHDERGDALGGFLQELIGRCLLKAPPASDGQWTWAVPTAPEWLALCGIASDGRPYPWGIEPPTPRHANLRFDGLPQKVQPVGLLSAGRSTGGVWDCCGNVHELVEWRPGALGRAEPTTADLRLAGGSFRNRPENASCRTFRRLTAESAPRWNVGLRLIRHRGQDAGLRTDALKRFRAELFQTRELILAADATTAKPG